MTSTATGKPDKYARRVLAQLSLSEWKKPPSFILTETVVGLLNHGFVERRADGLLRLTDSGVKRLATLIKRRDALQRDWLARRRKDSEPGSGQST